MYYLGLLQWIQRRLLPPIVLQLYYKVSLVLFALTKSNRLKLSK